MASMASGIGRPPRIRTPSISKANAYLSVTSVAAGVAGSDMGSEKSSSWCLANSMAAATSWASLGAIRCCGGTTTVGERRLSSAVVASWELSLRKVRGLEGGMTVDMIANCCVDAATKNLGHVASICPESVSKN